MTPKITTAFVSYCILALAGSFPIVLPDHLATPRAAAGASVSTELPSSITHIATVRDFREWSVAPDHGDFGWLQLQSGGESCPAINGKLERRRGVRLNRFCRRRR